MTKRTGSNINVRVPKLPRFDLFSSEQHEESIYLNDTDRFVSCENEEEKNQDFDARDNISLIKILPQTIPSSLFPNQEEEYVKISKETSPSVANLVPMIRIIRGNRNNFVTIHLCSILTKIAEHFILKGLSMIIIHEQMDQTLFCHQKYTVNFDIKY